MFARLCVIFMSLSLVGNASGSLVGVASGVGTVSGSVVETSNMVTSLGGSSIIIESIKAQLGVAFRGLGLNSAEGAQAFALSKKYQDDTAIIALKAKAKKAIEHAAIIVKTNEKKEPAQIAQALRSDKDLRIELLDTLVDVTSVFGQIMTEYKSALANPNYDINVGDRVMTAASILYTMDLVEEYKKEIEEVITNPNGVLAQVVNTISS